MRKETKLGKRKKRQKALKLLQSDNWRDISKGQKFLKQASRVPFHCHTKSNY